MSAGESRDTTWKANSLLSGVCVGSFRQRGISCQPPALRSSADSILPFLLLLAGLVLTIRKRQADQTFGKPKDSLIPPIMNSRYFGLESLSPVSSLKAEMHNDESLRRFNQATYKDLVSIERIGQKLAQAILTFRDRQDQAHLTEWESLRQVYGINERRINAIRLKFEEQSVAEVPEMSTPPSHSEPPQSEQPESRPPQSKASREPSQREQPQSPLPQSESMAKPRWEITALPQENRPSRPRWFWWLIGLGVPIAIFYGFFLYGLTVELGYREQTLALESTVVPLTRDLDAARATIAQLKRDTTVERVEVTRQVTVVVEITQEVQVEETGFSAQFAAAEIRLDNVCGEVDPPCVYLIRQGDARTEIADQSPLADVCRWPEILDLNRTSPGSYPSLSEGFPLFIPQAVERGTYPPMINDRGEWRLIQECTNASGTPCLYTVEDGLYGNRYSEVARIFYQDPTLANVIVQANRESDCSTNPIALHPGLQIVIPVPIRSAD